jgi:hypothetical protein
MRRFSHHFIIILLFVLLSLNNLNGQDNPYPTHWTFYAGTTIPIGDFASSTVYNARFALLGFSAMIESSNGISKDITWTGSVTMAVNGFDENGLNKVIVPNVSAGSYYSFEGMTGFQLESLLLSPDIKIWLRSNWIINIGNSGW